MDMFLGKPVSFWVCVLHLLATYNISDEEITNGGVKIVKLSPQEVLDKVKHESGRHNQS